MRVKNVYVLNGISKDELMKYVYSVEKFSNHPIAKSIINFGIDHNIVPEKNVTDFNNESGFGVSAKVNNKVMFIGNERFMKSKNIPISSVFVHADKNNLFVSINNKIAGIIEVEDKIKDEAKMVVKKLKAKKFNLFMISGDNESAAKKTAEELGIDNYSYRTLPEEKETIISKLQSEDKNVAMIGDGINDAPSLARANVGIAVGTGQDIAIDSADLILVKGDLNNILKSIKLSDKTVSVIRENFFWAFFYNIVAIPFAAGLFVPYGIIVSPIMAAMLMAFSDVITVIVNSLRLKYVKIN
jgi:Cu+-exporting ATPase